MTGGAAEVFHRYVSMLPLPLTCGHITKNERLCSAKPCVAAVQRMHMCVKGRSVGAWGVLPVNQPHARNMQEWHPCVSNHTTAHNVLDPSALGCCCSHPCVFVLPAEWLLPPEPATPGHPSAPPTIHPRHKRGLPGAVMLDRSGAHLSLCALGMYDDCRTPHTF